MFHLYFMRYYVNSMTGKGKITELVSPVLLIEMFQLKHHTIGSTVADHVGDN
jgi:hypothetical protein